MLNAKSVLFIDAPNPFWMLMKLWFDPNSYAFDYMTSGASEPCPDLLVGAKLLKRLGAFVLFFFLDLMANSWALKNLICGYLGLIINSLGEVNETLPIGSSTA